MKQKDGIILSCFGYELTSNEKKFFKNINPFGFVLFKRNFKTNQMDKTQREKRLERERKEAERKKQISNQQVKSSIAKNVSEAEQIQLTQLNDSIKSNNPGIRSSISYLTVMAFGSGKTIV